jgi:hypothetical protein
VDDYLAEGRWFRLTSLQGQFFLGAYRYNASSHLSKQTLEITFDPQTREFVCLSEDGAQSIRFLCQGLSKADLMGELVPFITWPAYQLELPFSRAAWRKILICDNLIGTTLWDLTNATSLHSASATQTQILCKKPMVVLKSTIFNFPSNNFLARASKSFPFRPIPLERKGGLM